MKQSNHFLTRSFVLIGLCFFTIQLAVAQTGISVSPPRTYFTLNPGQSETKVILVSNPSKTNTLELSVAMNEWEYDKAGNNEIKEAGTLSTTSASFNN